MGFTAQHSCTSALSCLCSNSTACPDTVLSIIFWRGIMYFPLQLLAAVVYKKARSHLYKWHYSFHAQELHLAIILELGTYHRVKLMEVTSFGDISSVAKAPGISLTFHIHFRCFCGFWSVREVTEKGNDFTFSVNSPSNLLYEADSKPEPLSGQELCKPQSPSNYSCHAENDEHQSVVGSLWR